jgi:hypothetical protein
MNELILLFISILWCSQTSDHPQEYLAKFGYRPGMKGKKINESFTFFATWWNKIEKSSDVSKTIVKNLATGKPKKTIFLAILKKRTQLVKFSQEKKTLIFVCHWPIIYHAHYPDWPYKSWRKISKSQNLHDVPISQYSIIHSVLPSGLVMVWCNLQYWLGFQLAMFPNPKDLSDGSFQYL